MDYFHGGEKPYLISGADDRLVKIWDYQVCLFVFLLSFFWNGFSKAKTLKELGREGGQD